MKRHFLKNSKKELIIFCLLASVNVFSQTEAVRLNGNTQGTSYSIIYYDTKQRNFRHEIEELLKKFDASLSLWDSTSVISRVNRNEADVKTDKYFKKCYKRSAEISEITGGAFDFTVGPLVKAWGFSKESRVKVDSAMVDSILQFVGYQLVRLKGRKVLKQDPRICIDFNAVAQGYSVDLVSDFLKKKGVSSYLVEIGGEVFARNTKPNGENWKVGIEQAEDNRETENPLSAVIKLENKALSTSGNYRKFYIENGVKYSHSINPASGYPVSGKLLSASVLAKDCITADAYATAFMVMGKEKALEFLQEHPELMVYFISSGPDDDYDIYSSPGFMEQLIIEEK